VTCLRLGKEKETVFLLLIIAAMVAFGIFSNIFSTPPFDSEFKKMSKIWLDRGIKEEKLHLAVDELRQQPEEKLLEMKADLAFFKAHEKNDSIIELATVYDSLIDYIIAEKRLASAKAALAGKENPCESIPYYEELVKESEELLYSTNNYVANANDFARLHAEQSRKIAMFSSKTISKKDTGLNKMKQFLEALKEACK